MKKLISKIMVVAGTALLLQGCIAIPPLIQVQHKDGPPAQVQDPDLKRRLDSIDRRLDDMQKQMDQRREPRRDEPGR